MFLDFGFETGGADDESKFKNVSRFRLLSYKSSRVRTGNSKELFEFLFNNLRVYLFFYLKRLSNSIYRF